MSSYLIPFIQTGIANSSNSSNIANTANFANYAGNVTVSNQPNITSVGNLTYLNVDGNIIGNNLSITNNSNIKDLNSNGNINFSGSNISLGSVNNLHISGGTSGYVLQTDGGGNLSWVAQTGGNGGNGNGTVAGTNTEVQYNNAGSFGASPGFTFNNASNTFNVPGNITSTTNNGNLYLTGWSNVTTLTNPSLFIGNLVLSPGDTNVYAPNGTNYINLNTTLVPKPYGSANYNFSTRVGEPFPNNITFTGHTIIGNVTYIVTATNTGYTSSDGFNFTTINNVAPNYFPTSYEKNVISNGSNVFCINYAKPTSVGNSQNFLLESIISSNFSSTYNTYTTGNLITSITANVLSLNKPIGAYGNGIYVVCIDYATLFPSTDGLVTLFSNNAQTWTSSNIGNSVDIGDLKYINNKFVALTQEANVNVAGLYSGLYTSSDGNNWTKQSIGNIVTNPTETGYSFIGQNFAGQFITAGYQSNGNNNQQFTAYSNDAITWTINIFSGNIAYGDVFFTGGNKLLATQEPYTFMYMSTNDGNSWTTYQGTNLTTFGQTIYYSSTGRLNVGSNLKMQPTKIATYYSNGILSQYASIGNYAFLGGIGNQSAANSCGLWIKGS